MADNNEAPSFGRESYTFELAENADGRTTAVALGPVAATDPDDGDTVSYRIVDGNDAGLFAIDKDTGALSYVGAGEDYEAGGTSHLLTVRASDGTLHGDTTVTVTVTDVRLPPPVPKGAHSYKHGDAGDNILEGKRGYNSGTDVMMGRGGDDTLRGFYGTDWLEGGSGDDTLDGGKGADVLVGGRGDDTLTGGGTSYHYLVRKLIPGEDGASFLWEGGWERRHHSDGKDRGDLFAFGDQHGDDTITDFNTATDLVDLSRISTSFTFEQLKAKITGAGSAVKIDLTDFGGGTIVLEGILPSELTAAMFVLPGQESRLDLHVVHDGHHSVNDFIIGDDGDNTFTTGRGNDKVYAADGDDTIYGGSGHDDLYGDDGNDTIYGGDGDDRIVGGRGDDTIDGGDGRDSMYGGAGRDTFVFQPGHNDGGRTTNKYGSNYIDGVPVPDVPWPDLIASFNKGEDKIDLSAFKGITSFDDLNIVTKETGLGLVERWIETQNIVYSSPHATIDLSDQEGGGRIQIYIYGTDADGNKVKASLDADDFIFYTPESVEAQQSASPPSFGSASYTVALPENVDGKTTAVALGSVSATDPDAGDAVTYSIEGGNDAGLFAINSDTGALTYVGGGEDHETTASHELTVRASDGTLHDEVTVTVTVTNVNEEPSFGAASYAFDLEENLDGRTTAVALGSVSATDPDAGDTVTYSIEGGNEAGLFAIDKDTGALTYVGAGEDHETTASHELTVRASDGTLHDEVTVTVTVADMAETPVGTVDSADDFTAGTDTTGTVGLSATATDVSVTGEIETAGDRDWFAVTLVAGRTYQFDLKGAATRNGEFGTLADPHLRGIHDANGTLVSGTTDDNDGWGANARVTFTPVADGTYYVAAGGAGNEVGTYTLRVRDVSPADLPDAPSFGAASYAFDLKENLDGRTTAVALGSVSATDPDAGDTLTYSIEGGNDAGLFAINKDTGALSYVGGGENHETTASHELTVRASDGTLHDEVTVTVTVTNVNEEPSFGAASYAFDLAENVDGRTTGVALGSVSATDPDAGDTVTYSIESGNDAGLFAIDKDTGALTYVGAGEDYESGTKSYELTVRASDGTLHDEVTVTVAVTDVVEAPVVVVVEAPVVTADSGDDFAAGTNTTGAVSFAAATDVSVTGEIETAGDRDWFAVTLVAGKTYQFDLKGSGTQGGRFGTLTDPYLYGLYDANGNALAGTADDDSGWGDSGNARVQFTPTADGTFYVAAGGAGEDVGTYTLRARVFEDDFAPGTNGLGSVDFNGDWGGNSRVEFTATADATWYMAADAAGNQLGDYTLSVEEVL